MRRLAWSTTVVAGAMAAASVAFAFADDDVERVGAHLHAAVRETVQPSHLSLWVPIRRRTP